MHIHIERESQFLHKERETLLRTHSILSYSLFLGKKKSEVGLNILLCFLLYPLFWNIFLVYFCTFLTNNIIDFYQKRAETDPRTRDFWLIWEFERVGMRFNGEIPVEKEEDKEEEQKGREVNSILGVGFLQPQKLVVGYALTSKKKKSFLQPKLLGLAR